MGALEQAHQVRYVPLQSSLARGGKLIPGHGAPPAVALVDSQVAGILQLAQVSPEAAILFLKYPLQAAERHGIVLG